MFVGSFSQDSSEAFNNSASYSHMAAFSINDPQIGIGTDGITAPVPSVLDNLPTGSRLFNYMNPGQVSRKSSRSSTGAEVSATTTTPISPSPHFASRMSPYAAAFQPSSSKRCGQNATCENAQVTEALEHKFASVLSLAAQQPNTNQFIGQGMDFCTGELPTPPDSSAPSKPTNANSLRRKISETPIACSAAPVPNVSVESIGGTTYFFNSPASDAYPQEGAGREEHTNVDGNCQPNVVLPDVFTFNGPLSSMEHYKPRGALAASSYFAPNEIKMELMRRQLLCVAQIDPEEMPDLPHEVDCYHHLVPLELVPAMLAGERPGYFGAVTTVYKANSTKTGIAYCLRRIHNYRLTNMRCLAAIDAWKKLQHSSVVQIREVFTTKAFGDYSVVFVYDYYPGAVTLKTKYFDRRFGSSTSLADGAGSSKQNGKSPFADTQAVNGGTAGLLPEAAIWCYVIQLSSALRQIHALGLAARTIDPTKLLAVGKSRLMINCCGLFDLLMFNQIQQHNVVKHHQQEDLTHFGLIVLALACNNPLAAVQRDQWQQSIAFVARHYSPDLKNLILYLTAPQRVRNVNDVMPMIGARFYTLLEAAHYHTDTLENELTKEVDNGRLFRLLCKLGAVNERPEFSMDSHWSETGDRYLLKLFRDYLFHQVTQDGRPWLDLAHVVHCLNKLDAGISEKIMLSSRDQQNVLIVSYADLHRCLDQAFQELLRSSAGDDPGASPALFEQGNFNISPPDTK